MTLKSKRKDVDGEELKFFTELGWFAAMAVSIVAFVPFIFD
jgi:hypothetical protein